MNVQKRPPATITKGVTSALRYANGNGGSATRTTIITTAKATIVATPTPELASSAVNPLIATRSTPPQSGPTAPLFSSDRSRGTSFVGSGRAARHTSAPSTAA